MSATTTVLYEGHPSLSMLRAKLRVQAESGSWYEVQGTWAKGTFEALNDLTRRLGDRLQEELSARERNEKTNARGKDAVVAELTNARGKDAVVAELTRENGRLHADLRAAKDELAVMRSSTYDELVKQRDALLIERNRMIEQVKKMATGAVSCLNEFQAMGRST